MLRPLSVILAVGASPALAATFTQEEVDGVCHAVFLNGAEIMGARQRGVPFDDLQAQVNTFTGAYHDILQAMLEEAFHFPDMDDPVLTRQIIAQFALDSEASCRETLEEAIQ